MTAFSLKAETYSYKTELWSEGPGISVATLVHTEQKLSLDSEQGKIFLRLFTETQRSIVPTRNPLVTSL